MLFRKTEKNPDKQAEKAAARSSAVLSVIAKDTHILGTLISDGSIDFDGTIDGNIRCRNLSIRKNGNVKGDIEADSLHIYGKVEGLIRAKYVKLYAGCHVEGVIMHETIIMEDGAFMDGKCKRTDRAEESRISETGDEDFFAPPIRLIS